MPLGKRLLKFLPVSWSKHGVRDSYLEFEMTHTLHDHLYLVYARRDMESVPEHLPEEWSPALKQCARGCWKDEELFRPVKELSPVDRARLWELIRARQGTPDRLQFDPHALAAIFDYDNFLRIAATAKVVANALANALPMDDTELGAEFELMVDANHCDNANYADNFDGAVNEEQVNAGDLNGKPESEATVGLHDTPELPLKEAVRSEEVPTMQPDTAELSTESCSRPRDGRTRAQSDPQSDLGPA